jgi:hypothetical protein
MKIIANGSFLDWKMPLSLLLFAASIPLSAHAGTASTSKITPTSNGFTIQINSGSEILKYQWQAPALNSLYSVGSVTVTDSVDGASPQAEITLSSKIDWVGPSRKLQSVSIDPASAKATLAGQTMEDRWKRFSGSPSKEGLPFSRYLGIMHSSPVPASKGDHARERCARQTQDRDLSGNRTEHAGKSFRSYAAVSKDSLESLRVGTLPASFRSCRAGKSPLSYRESVEGPGPSAGRAVRTSRR